MNFGMIKKKHGENAKLFSIDLDSFIIHVKADDIALQKTLKQDLIRRVLN